MSAALPGQEVNDKLLSNQTRLGGAESKSRCTWVPTSVLGQSETLFGNMFVSGCGGLALMFQFV